MTQVKIVKNNLEVLSIQVLTKTIRFTVFETLQNTEGERKREEQNIYNYKCIKIFKNV